MKKKVSKEKRKKTQEKKKNKEKLIPDISVPNEEISFSENFFDIDKVNLSQLQKDIEQEAMNVHEFILTDELIKERGQCLNMMGKICSSMNLKR